MKTLCVGRVGNSIFAALSVLWATALISGCSRADHSTGAARESETEIAAEGPALVTPDTPQPSTEEVIEPTNESSAGSLYSFGDQYHGSSSNVAEDSNADVWDPLSMPEPLSIPAASDSQVGDADAIEGTFDEETAAPETAGLVGTDDEAETLR